MGSVVDYFDCPICSQPNCISDYNYRTREEYIFCFDCGYEKTIEIIDRSKLLTDITEKDIKVTEIRDPYCSYLLVNKKEKIKQIGTLITHKDYKDFINDIFNKIYDIEDLKISRYDGSKILKIELNDILR